jgi:hypothetical protein
MHADDEHLLVLGAIEDADPLAFRQTAGRAPKKIVLSSSEVGCLKLKTSQPCAETRTITATDASFRAFSRKLASRNTSNLQMARLKFGAIGTWRAACSSTRLARNSVLRSS